MRKRTSVVISLLAVCALAGGAFLITSNSNAQNKNNTDDLGGPETSSVDARTANPLIAINNQSRAAKNGGETEVRAFADGIFTAYHFDEAPAGIGEAIKDRLVTAELNYINGKGQKGISEASVVRAVNYLAYKTGAPSFAQTNVFELRRMKISLLPYTADLQARSRMTEIDRPNQERVYHTSATTPSMSPLEATLFMVLLVQQKQYNAEYQLTNQEFVALRGGSRQANSDKQFRTEMESRTGDSSRSVELERSVEKRVAAMNLSEIVNLPQELMYVLGIQK